MTVTVANVAPTVVLSGDAEVNEGDATTYTYTVPTPATTRTRRPSRVAPTAPGPTRRRRHFDCTFPDGPELDVSVQATD